jgi:hypothetical protein
VSAEATLIDNEVTTYTLDDGEVSQETIDRDQRDRLVRVTAEQQLIGVRYEVEPGFDRGRDVTYARAIVDRNELAAVYAAEVQTSLAVARVGAQYGDVALRSSAGPSVVEGIVAAVRGQRALDEPRPLIPVIVGLRPVGGAGAILLGEHGRLEQDLATTLYDIGQGLELRIVNGPIQVSLSGQVPSLEIEARWNGQVLAGLPVGLDSNGLVAASGHTDSAGRVVLKPVEPASAGAPARLGVVVDDQVAPIKGRADLLYPSAAASRVAIVSQHAGEPTAGPPLGELEAFLARLHFRVVPASTAARLGRLEAVSTRDTDYVLTVDSSTRFSSESGTGRGDLGRTTGKLYWYRTDLVATLTETATRESISVSIKPEQTKGVGRTHEDGARNSLNRAYKQLLDGTDPDALPALLRSRFAVGAP